LEEAIEKNDLIAMRRHERPEGYIKSFVDCAARVRSIKPPENEQMNLFTDYNSEDDGEWGVADDTEEDDDWGDEEEY